MTLSNLTFSSLGDLVYSHAGLRLKEDKVAFISRRVDARMKELDLRSERDYLRFLRFDRTGQELGKLIELIVIPETYFFRDYRQLQVFAEEVLPEVVRGKGDNRELSILSAGCSTGEEASTLAIILREMLGDVDAWNLRIDGLDISARALAKARNGVCSDRALRSTPTAYRRTYFAEENGINVLDGSVRRMVNFMSVNLYDGAQMASWTGYDVVFCRNVLIYFDQASATKVVGHLHEAMRSGGFLFLGHAELAGRFTSAFKMVRFGDMFVYQK